MELMVHLINDCSLKNFIGRSLLKVKLFFPACVRPLAIHCTIGNCSWWLLCLTNNEFPGDEIVTVTYIKWLDDWFKRGKMQGTFIVIHCLASVTWVSELSSQFLPNYTHSSIVSGVTMICNLLTCCFPEDPEVKRSRDLDRSISLWMKQYKQSIKLLLLGKIDISIKLNVIIISVNCFNFIIITLGTGESGKTTIIKQMKILHVQGFTAKERAEKAQQIRRNLLESIRVSS